MSVVHEHAIENIIIPHVIREKQLFIIIFVAKIDFYFHFSLKKLRMLFIRRNLADRNNNLNEKIIVL